MNNPDLILAYEHTKEDKKYNPGSYTQRGPQTKTKTMVFVTHETS